MASDLWPIRVDPDDCRAVRDVNDVRRQNCFDAKELGGASRGRPGDERWTFTGGNDRAAIHEVDAISEGERFFQIVRDQNRCRARLTEAGAKRGEELDAGRGVERAERLVQEENGGVGNEGSRQSRARCLATRETARPSLGEVADPEAHQPERGARLRLTAWLAAKAKSGGGIGQDGNVKEERLLEDDRERPSQRRGILRASDLTEDCHRPVVGLSQERGDVKESSLAGAIGPDDGDGLARGDGEARDVEDRAPAMADEQILDLNDRQRH
jgi:hypothetical protein